MTTSIDEVKARIAQANEIARDSQGALRQAQVKLDEAVGVLVGVLEGSDKADVSEAISAIGEAKRTLEETVQLVRAAMDSADEVAGRL